MGEERANENVSQYFIRQAQMREEAKKHAFAIGLSAGILILFLASPFLIRTKIWKQYDKLARFGEFKLRGGKMYG